MEDNIYCIIKSRNIYWLGDFDNRGSFVCTIFFEILRSRN